MGQAFPATAAPLGLPEQDAAHRGLWGLQAFVVCSGPLISHRPLQLTFLPGAILTVGFGHLTLFSLEKLSSFLRIKNKSRIGAKQQMLFL